MGPISTDQRGRIRNPRRRELLYLILAKRDGPKCAKCGALDSERELVINHMDGNTRNGSLQNLNLLCRSCNLPERRDRSTAPIAPISSIPSVSESERDRVFVQGEHGMMLKEASAEIQLNREREPEYRKWLMNRLISEGRVLLGDAINGGAESCHISPITARRYLSKMTSTEGPLSLLDRTWVLVKADHWAKLRVEG